LEGKEIEGCLAGAECVEEIATRRFRREVRKDRTWRDMWKSMWMASGRDISLFNALGIATLWVMAWRGLQTWHP
jgi:hypothetical protein